MQTRTRWSFLCSLCSWIIDHEHRSTFIRTERTSYIFDQTEEVIPDGEQSNVLVIMHNNKLHLMELDAYDLQRHRYPWWASEMICLLYRLDTYAKSRTAGKADRLNRWPTSQKIAQRFHWCLMFIFKGMRNHRLSHRNFIRSNVLFASLDDMTNDRRDIHVDWLEIIRWCCTISWAIDLIWNRNED